VADIISFGDVVQARRRARERELAQACVYLLETNLHLAVHRFAAAPECDRPVRARQIRQLAELLEYVTAH